MKNLLDTHLVKAKIIAKYKERQGQFEWEEDHLAQHFLETKDYGRKEHRLIVEVKRTLVELDLIDFVVEEETLSRLTSNGWRFERFSTYNAAGKEKADAMDFSNNKEAEGRTWQNKLADYNRASARTTARAEWIAIIVTILTVIIGFIALKKH